MPVLHNAIFGMPVVGGLTLLLRSLFGEDQAIQQPLLLYSTDKNRYKALFTPRSLPELNRTGMYVVDEAVLAKIIILYSLALDVFLICALVGSDEIF